MLFGAIGCNLAWGIVDAFMYLINNITERGQGILKQRAVRGAKNPEAAQRIIVDALPKSVASVLQQYEIESLRQRLSPLPEPPARPRLGKQDFLGAVGVFLIVFLSTFPVVIPFIFMHNAQRALRISNAIALVMLFLCGYWLGRHAGHRPWGMGFAMVVVGSVLVAITIALGG
jgi:VIT1/CCC1 family predicted Fe2+/Mn2+ transporter